MVTRSEGKINDCSMGEEDLDNTLRAKRSLFFFSAIGSHFENNKPMNLIGFSSSLRSVISSIGSNFVHGDLGFEKYLSSCELCNKRIGVSMSIIAASRPSSRYSL